MDNKTMVETFNELKKENSEFMNTTPFYSSDGCYIYDALMCIAGILAVIADIMRAKEKYELAEKYEKYNDKLGQW